MLPPSKNLKRKSRKSRKKKRGIYLLPNLLTTGNLFCGFYGIVAAINHNFRTAAIAILFACLFDILDGKVARLTGSGGLWCGARHARLSMGAQTIRPTGVGCSLPLCCLRRSPPCAVQCSGRFSFSEVFRWTSHTWCCTHGRHHSTFLLSHGSERPHRALFITGHDLPLGFSHGQQRSIQQL